MICQILLSDTCQILFSDTCQILVRCHTESMWVGVLLAPYHCLTARGWGNGSIQIWKDRGRQSLQLECLRRRMLLSLGVWGWARCGKAWLCCILKSCLMLSPSFCSWLETSNTTLWVFHSLPIQRWGQSVRQRCWVRSSLPNFRDLQCRLRFRWCSVVSLFFHVLLSIKLVRFSTRCSWQLAGLAARASWIWRFAFMIWKGQTWSKTFKDQSKGMKERHEEKITWNKMFFVLSIQKDPKFSQVVRKS